MEMSCALGFFLFVIPAFSYAARSADWDIFMFTQQWPPTVCVMGTEEHHRCQFPPPVMQSWGVHGIWPTKRGTEGPTSCNPDMPFNESKIKGLEPELKKYWPNMFGDTSDTEFWQHEWDKHGTCCTDLPATSGELNYFSKALQLRQEHDIIGVLTQNNIVPSETATYQLGEIQRVLKAAIGFIPYVDCYWDHTHKKQLLSEVRICLSKTFGVVDCFSSGNGSSAKRDIDTRSHHHHPSQTHHTDEKSNCYDTEGIYYPPYPHSDFDANTTG